MLASSRLRLGPCACTNLIVGALQEYSVIQPLEMAWGSSWLITKKIPANFSWHLIQKSIKSAGIPIKRLRKFVVAAPHNEAHAKTRLMRNNSETLLKAVDTSVEETRAIPQLNGDVHLTSSLYRNPSGCQECLGASLKLLGSMSLEKPLNALTSKGQPCLESGALSWAATRQSLE